MFYKLIEHKMNQINKLYGSKNRIECIEIFDNYYSIDWNYNGHKRRTKYTGSAYECYQFLRAFLLERRVKVYALPLYHSKPVTWIREHLTLSKTDKEFTLDFLAVGLMMLALLGLATVL